jgi:phosphate transport system permease protein
MVVWAALLLLVLASAVAFGSGRRKALVSAAGDSRKLHSRTNYYGAFVALWVGVPAILLLILFATLGERVEQALLQANPSEAVAQLTPEQQALFYQDVTQVSAAQRPSETIYAGPLRTAFDSDVARLKGLKQTVTYASLAAVLVLALAGFLLAFPRISPDFRARNQVEGWIGALLFTCSAVAILTTVGIVASLAFESIRFFAKVPPLEFLLGTQWSPQIAMREDQVASEGAFGAVPLFAGTFLIMLIAMAVAAPIGLYAAIYLSEYAGKVQRAVIKPLLEILAGVPTVVYGFFAALTVGPLFRGGFNALGAMMIGGPLDGVGQYLMEVQNQMALVAGVVMGIMLIPFVSSLSDDIINSVPQSLRDGSYALGATRSETVRQVVLPAALPGIAGALLLAVSRAVGETMIVTMAAGLQARLTVNPLDTVTTVTVQIVTLLTGDQEFDSAKTLAAFGLGLTLFVITLILNIAALMIVRRYREQYD